MPYLIDGHNLIGQLPDLSLTDPDDEAKLVLKLVGFVARTKKKVVVVFDHGLPGGKSKLSTHSVEVVFASNPGDADSIMKGRIAKAKDTAQWTVVSNDHAVLDVAKARGMKTLRSRDFVPMLHDTTQRKQAAKRASGEASDVYVSPKEVEEWLKVFGGEEGDKVTAVKPTPKKRH
jgi:hypothetical protein